MHEDETILQDEVKIRDIGNQAAALGDKIPENRLVRKVLRSLSSRFKVKKIAIEEHKNVDAMSMDELIGSLKTFEMNEEASDSYIGKKKTDVALKSVILEEKGQEEIDSSCSTITLAELDERVAQLAQGLNRFMKKKQKGFKSSEQDNSEFENEDCNFVAFTAKYKESYVIENKHVKASVNEYEYENDSEEDPVEDILKQWEGLLAVTHELKIKITSLEKENDHYVKVIAEKQLRVLSLEEELRKSLDLVSQFSTDKKHQSRRVTHKIQLLNVHGHKYQVHRNMVTSHDRRKGFASVCYYCGKGGHIRKHCYRLLWDLRNSGSQHVKRVGTRLVWKKKEIGLYAAHSAITATTDGIWYFDSSCSRHMTGSAACLIDLTQSDGCQVTFGDGAKGVVLGGGTLAVEGMPSLTGVLLVKGLRANLISISQLCDQNLVVQFTKEGCCVSNFKNQSILKGARTADNCYQLQTRRRCNYSNTSDMSLWHKSGKTSFVCKGCMEGKQPRTHPSVPYVTTSLPLELLHMDLMGPVHTPSIAGKRDREYLSKFDSRSKEGIFVGYSRNSHAYRVYFKQSNSVIKSINVRIDDQEGWLVNDDDVNLDKIEPVPVGSSGSSSETVTQPGTVTPTVDVPLCDTVSVTTMIQTEKDTLHEVTIEKTPSFRVHKNHPTELIIGNIHDGIKTRGKRPHFAEMVQFVCYTSSLEPKKVEDALKDEYWIKAMQEELEQFERNEVWTLVPRPENANIIGTKWIFKNKTDESGNITKNKARLVSQGYTQVEGVDFDETFAPVARLESIRLLILVASVLQLKLHQMDVKSAFLNGYLSKEVYVEQPKGFSDPKYPDHVYRLSKDCMDSNKLRELDFIRGGVDKTLFIKKKEQEVTIAQIYVDDIIFGSTSEHGVKRFVRDMQGEFEMSMMGKLAYFLGFQVKQKEDANRPDISYSVGVCARFQSTPRESHVKLARRILSDADWAGNVDDRKSTSGGCFYLGLSSLEELLGCVVSDTGRGDVSGEHEGSEGRRGVLLTQGSNTKSRKLLSSGISSVQTEECGSFNPSFACSEGLSGVCGSTEVDQGGESTPEELCEGSSQGNLVVEQCGSIEALNAASEFVKSLSSNEVVLENPTLKDMLNEIVGTRRSTIHPCVPRPREKSVAERVNAESSENGMSSSEDEDVPLRISRRRSQFVIDCSQSNIVLGDIKSRLRDSTIWKRKQGMTSDDPPIQIDEEDDRRSDE
ncbi:hypothetical protein H6P81_015685 [Aristolochia fimbriata]|uniref:CCHC-type domain-containing protein n=1 Tax=Aristolochia fimbriata TaxID=158543 RepID=A0AAV7E688_ARIFI|nr:hypothetical protein H6P81_015685 [Aristolochia fimbriata]